MLRRLSSTLNRNTPASAASPCHPHRATRGVWMGVLRLLCEPAPPNPSFKPSPNSKTPGPRCSVGVHFLQRGPAVLLPVPA